MNPVNATIDVQWPARSRALDAGLTSAQSATIFLPASDGHGNHISFNIDRDAAQTAAHTETYQVPTMVDPARLTTLRATFYAQPGSTGDEVGVANADVTVSGGHLNLASVTLTGDIKVVTLVPVGDLAAGGQTTQLSFSAKTDAGAIVAVTPGSATWTVANGTAATITPDGVLTPVTAGVANVVAVVDGVTSAPLEINVTTAAVSTYKFPSGKGGALTTPTFDAVEGNLFQVAAGHDIQVSALGVEFEQNGQPDHQVAIFDAATGNILAQATISSADTLADGYYWTAITPITLTAGQQYYIGALHGTGASWSYFNDTRPSSAATYIQDIGTYFKASSTLAGGAWQATTGTSQYGSGPVRRYVASFQGTRL